MFIITPKVTADRTVGQSCIHALHSSTSSLSSRNRRGSGSTRRQGFTLVEMLIALAITLLLMASVVSVFAMVSSSVQKRRAVMEVSNQLRHVRNVLQRDLEGATCPLLPWQKPESSHGYFEIIEGYHADFAPSLLTDDQPVSKENPEIDHAASTIPSTNLDFNSQSGHADWVTDGGGLGDYDDVLALTTRNESEPFNGRAPLNNVDTNNGNARIPFGLWQSQSIKSPVAEVVWYCIENPTTDTDNYFGEPGYRTLYRRVLLVAPWLNYSYNADANGPVNRTGVLRVMQSNVDSIDKALASLIAFQERYDISARVEFNPTIDTQNGGRWTIVANTLADLTKRENRYEHHGIVGSSSPGQRNFPFVLQSAGGGGSSSVQFVVDPELNAGSGAAAKPLSIGSAVVGYDVSSGGSGYSVRPLAMLEGGATARAIVNEQGEVVHLTTGLVPLGQSPNSTSRRGEDLMLSHVLGFDLRVFDPQAPVFAVLPNGNPLTDINSVDPNLDLTTVDPGDAGWSNAARNGVVVNQGAYVDLGYAALYQSLFGASLPGFNSPFAGLARSKSKLRDARLTRVYDTWSFHYENNGIDENGSGTVDEGTDGFDSLALYTDGGPYTRLGVDDPAERETSPPYPSPLRAIQVQLRVYESDSQQPREVTVRQHFVPE